MRTSALPSMWTGSLINRVDAEDVLSFTEMLLKVNYEMPARAASKPPGETEPAKGRLL